MKGLEKKSYKHKFLALLLSVVMSVSLLSPGITFASEPGTEMKELEASMPIDEEQTDTPSIDEGVTDGSDEADPENVGDSQQEDPETTNDSQQEDSETADGDQQEDSEAAGDDQQVDSDTTENGQLEVTEDTEVAVQAASTDTVEPYFDFEAYDWSDPADYLNKQAADLWEYWDDKGTALFPDWNYSYFSLDKISDWGQYTEDASKITSREYIKEKIDNGVFPTDEKFFGVWDEATQTWTSEPMIDYSVVSMYDPQLDHHLADVEEATKAGDYPAAEEAYLAYHRNLLQITPLTTPTVTTDMKNRSDMLLRDMYIHSSFPATGWFYMDQEESDITVDVTSAVESKRDGKGAIVLVAPDKDEYRAEFYSKEGAEKAGNMDYAPYIEVYVGGVRKTIQVEEDAYVGGDAENNTTPFGSTDPDRLLVSEAEDYEAEHTAVEGYLIGEEMRRTYLLFDFASVIGEGDVISSATLHLRGKVTDFAETPRNDPSYRKLIAVTGLSTDDFDEETVTFASNILVNGVYSEQSRYEEQQSFFWGPLKSSGDDSQYPNARMHEDPFRFSGWWDQLVQTYYVTGNEDYARTAMLYLHDFIKTTYCLTGGMEDTPARWSSVITRNGIKGGHLLFGGYLSTLDTSQRSKIATNIQYLFNSEYMTPDLFVTFMKYIKVLGDKAVRETWSSSESGNWGSMQIDGHTQIMYKYPELAYTKPDEPGGYLLNWETAIGIHASISTDVFSDGAGGELSQAYTNVALDRFLNIKRGADEVQYPISFTDETMWKIESMAKFLFRTCRPGIKEAQYGDGNGVDNDYTKAVKFVADWTQDPELLWAAYDGEKGEQPDFTSYYYPVGKFFVMRNNWSDNAMYLHTNADFADGAHSHWDDGGIIVSAYGNYLLADVGYMGYGLDSVPYRWQISSRGHNTVEINDYSQSSRSPNDMDDALVSTRKYNEASDKGSASLPEGNHTYEQVVTGELHDFSKLDLSSVYKKLGYLQDPIMAPGGDGEVPPQEPGMNYKRNILFIKDGFWIVSDYMDPVDNQKVNKYSQYWHMAPEANISIDGQYVLQDGETVSWTHSDIEDIDKQIENTEYVPGTGTGAIQSNFNGQANIQVVPVGNVGNIGNVYDEKAEDASEAEANKKKNEAAESAAAEAGIVEPRLCYGYYTSGASTPYGRFDKYAVGTTKFDTILFPTKANEVYSVVPTPVEIEGLNEDAEEGSASAFTAEITAEEAAVDEDYKINYMILHEPDKKAGDDLTFSNLSTDGDLAYYEVSGTEKNPTPRRLIFHNGTHMKNTASDYELAYSRGNEDINEVSIKWSGSLLEIEAGKGRGDDGELLDGDFDVNAFLEDFTVFAPSKISSVTVNGESVAFKQADSYVYFGDEPILDDPGAPSPSPTPAPGGGSGSGGSHGGNSGGSGGGTGNGTGTVVPNPTPSSEPADQFSDELNGHWAEDEITYLVNNGIVNGSDGSLNLTAETTRAEFIKMMLGAMGIEPAAYNGAFGDVSADDWYAGYMQAAYDAGIIEGFSGNASPNATMTREEAVKIMVNALVSQGKAELTDGDLSGYADADLVSEWAKPYMATAISLGLINGMEDNTLQPQGSTLREQAMVMVYRTIMEDEDNTSGEESTQNETGSDNSAVPAGGDEAVLPSGQQSSGKGDGTASDSEDDSESE